MSTELSDVLEITDLPTRPAVKSENMQRIDNCYEKEMGHNPLNY